MKKRFIAVIVAAGLSVVSLLCGCSCGGKQPLAFTNAFYGGNEPNSAYTETLTYTVDYSEDGGYAAFKKDSSLDGLEFEFSGGVYESRFSVVTDLTGIESDITADLDTLNASVYLLETEFDITFKVTINGTQYTHDDYITTRAFVTSNALAFAPLYSYTESEYYLLSANKDGYGLSLVKSVFTVNYGKTEYRTSYKINSVNAVETDVVSLDDVAPVENAVKYDYRTAIDNAELFFALRGIKLDEKSSLVLPTVSAQYDGPAANGATDLSVVNNGQAETTLDITYNGTQYAGEKVAYNEYSFRINNSSVSGPNQYVKIQAKQSADLPARALPVVYVKPLFVYGTMVNFGALTFTLTDIAA